MSVNWGAVWACLWPILREGVIALLISVLALLGYDQVVPSRYARRSGEPATPEAAVYAMHLAEGAEMRKGRV